MGYVFTSRQHQSDFKNTVVKIFFLFYLGNGMLIINVIQSTFPLLVEFDVCQVPPFGDLMSQLQLQGYSLHMCSIPGPTEKPGIHPEWMDVRWNTGYKGYTSPLLSKC
jgi:hypothetical protein